MQEMQVQSPGWEVPLENGMATTPVFLPGEFHGQRNLVGYSPWDCIESDTTEQATNTNTWLPSLPALPSCLVLDQVLANVVREQVMPR